MLNILPRKLLLSFFLLSTLILQTLKADMMFYYSAAVLPSIVGKKAETPIKPMVSFKDAEHGYEPWIVDIENNEAHMVKDIHTANADAVIPDMFVTIVGITYFFADDGTNGYGLWKTDGSEVGTVLVKNYNNTMTPHQIFEFKGKVHFVASTEDLKKQLWVSDGTSDGTVCITKDAFERISHYKYILPVGDTLYFSAVNPSPEGSNWLTQLWKSDGTAEGTEQITNMEGYGPDKLLDVNGTLYFRFFTKNPKTKHLYRTDGAIEGMVVFPESYIGPSEPLVSLNGKIIKFNLLANTIEIFNGTQFELLKDFGDNKNIYGTTVLFRDMIVEGNYIYFVAHDNVNGTELRRTDGTVEGTILISASYLNEDNYGSHPANLTLMNNTLYYELKSNFWKVNENNASAEKIVNMPNSSAGISKMVGIDNALYILSDNHLFVANGEIDNLIERKVFKSQSRSSTYDFASIQRCGNKVCNYADDGESGFELWSTDNTLNGTTLLKDINSANKNSVFGRYDFYNNESFIYNKGSVTVSSKEYAKINNKYIFIGRDGSLSNLGQDDHSEFFLSNGTESGTEKITMNGERLSADVKSYGLFTLKNNLLYFIGKYNDDFYLCKTNGTVSGTARIKKIGARYAGSVTSLKNYNGILYFNWKNELWKSDGTENGTVFIHDLKINIEKIFLSEDGYLYIVTNKSLWVTDGNISHIVEHILDSNGRASRTKMFNFKDKTYLLNYDTSSIDYYEVGLNFVTHRIHSSGGDHLAHSKDYFYFDNNFNHELWKSDGTQEGTVLVKDGFDDLSVQQLIMMNNKLFFVASDEVHGEELWISDGTTAGTIVLKNITVGVLGSHIKILNIEKNKLLFTVTNQNGLQLWTSDGTKAGTKVMNTSNN